MEHRWDIKTIYLYMVAFVTLMMLLFGTVNGLQAAFDYFFQPRELYISPKFSEPYPDKSGKLTEEMQAAELERQAREFRYHQLQRLFNSAATVGVSLPVFFYHWRKIKAGEAEKS